MCEQIIDDERRRETLVVQDLFGSMAYTVCVCGQEPPDSRDQEYRRRLSAFLAERRKEREEQKP